MPKNSNPGGAAATRALKPQQAGRDTTVAPAQPVLPRYLETERAALVGFVRQHMAFLQPTSLNRLVRAIERPQNNLFNALAGELLNPDAASYICLTDDVRLPGKSQAQVAAAVKAQIAAVDLQERFPYFTNPFALCDQRDGEYHGPSPLDRLVNRGLVVLTFEYDPDGGQREFFGQQVRWSIAGSEKRSALDRLYDELCRFRDFRLLEVSWSGNKSFHIHVLVDSRHLARSRFPGNVDIPAGGYPEVPDGMLFRSGLMSSWPAVEQIVRATLGIDIGPDKRMREPDRYRRMPWGTRIATDHRAEPSRNILAVPVGTRIPQIVIYSRGRTYARSGDQWMLPPRTFFESRKIRQPRSKPAATTQVLDPPVEQDLIDAINRLCERLFGPPETAPFAVEVDRHQNDWRVWFRNNLADHNPGSFMIGRFNTILVGSKDPDIQHRRFEFPLSASELVETFLSDGTLSEKLPSRPRSWWEQHFADVMDWLHAAPDSPVESPFGFPIERPDIGDTVIPRPTFTSAVTMAVKSQFSLIVSVEGVSKSSTTMDVMLADEDDRRLFEAGFVVVACRSYEQARRKCAEFNGRQGPAQGFRGVVLRSLDDVMRELDPKFRTSTEDVARRGFSSAAEAIYSGPSSDEISRLDQYRRKIQLDLGWLDSENLDPATRATVVIFATHGLVQNWFRHGGTRYWLHPMFEAWLAARGDHDFTRAKRIGREIRWDTKFSWVLHDECAMSDLVSMHPKEKVEWVGRFIDAVPDYEKLGMPERLAAFEQYGGGLRPVSFDEMLTIAEIGYTEQDLFKVDPDREPFGVNNSARSPYLGQPEYYAKTRDWWSRNRYKLTVLTTERKIRTAFEHIRRQQLEAIEAHPTHGPALRQWRSDIDTLGILAKPKVPPVWSITDLPVAGYLPAERKRVDIYLDDRARAQRADQPDRPWVRDIYNEIKESDRNAIIIGNKAVDYGISPAKAKGLNNYIGRKIYYVMMFPSPDQYHGLMIENALFKSRDAVRLHLVDEFDQIAGRTLGFRHGPESQVIVIMPTRLWRQIGATLLTETNYEPKIVTDRPW